MRDFAYIYTSLYIVSSSATPILTSHLCTILQMNVTEPYTDVLVHCTSCKTSFIHDDLDSQAPTV